MASTDYFLAPSLKTFRASVDQEFPDRDKSSDGWLGDAAHAARASEHNPCWLCTGYQYGIVRAIDVDIDDNDAGRDLRREILNSVIGHPAVWYVISNGIIYSRTYGWEARKYNGPNGHFKHVHISINKNERSAKDLSLKLKALGQPKPPTGTTPSKPTRDLEISMWCIERLAQKRLGLSGECLVDAQIVMNIAAYFNPQMVQTTRPYFWAKCAEGNWQEAGRMLEYAVKVIQAATGLSQDGILGPKTAAALEKRGYTVKKV